MRIKWLYNEIFAIFMVRKYFVMKKSLYFSGFFIVCNNNPISEKKSAILEIKEDVIIGKSISIITLNLVEDRFVSISMANGSPVPRPSKVLNSDTYEEEDNPRQRNQFEPSDYFALIDYNSNLLWLSNIKKKEVIIKLFEKIGIKGVLLKDVYSEQEFVNSLSKLDMIKLSVVPNLLNDNNELSKHLETDIYGYGAEEASIELKFKNKSITDKIKDFVSSILSSRDNFRKLMIIGKNEHDLGMILNKKVFSRKIDIDVEYDEDDNIIDKDSILPKLIEKVKNEDK